MDVKEYQRRYYQKHKEEIKRKTTEYYYRNREAICKKQKGRYSKTKHCGTVYGGLIWIDVDKSCAPPTKEDIDAWIEDDKINPVYDWHDIQHAPTEKSLRMIEAICCGDAEFLGVKS